MCISLKCRRKYNWVNAANYVFNHVEIKLKTNIVSALLRIHPGLFIDISYFTLHFPEDTETEQVAAFAHKSKHPVHFIIIQQTTTNKEK